jgi:2-polyprenyl-3-methyl-5-hydroxy-6-metoxy-1,4-benzoquinol methylase
MKDENNLLDSAAQVFRERMPSGSRFEALAAGGSRAAPEAGNFQFAAIETAEMNLPYMLRLSRSVESAVPKVGDMPPEPPTTRGRVGAFLVQAVRRALFWYTSQIHAFHTLVAEAAREQIASIQELASRQLRQQALLADVLRRLGEMEQERERSSSRLTGQIARQEEQIRELREALEVSQENHARELREVQKSWRETHARELCEMLDGTREMQLRELREAQQRWRDDFQGELIALEQTLANRIAQVDAGLTDIGQAMKAEGREVRNQIHRERTHLLQQEFRLKMLLREFRKSPPAMQPMSEETRHTDDALFVDHASAFRGSRAEIKSRLAVYTPYVDEAFAATGRAPALDVGCGRGEWLELLKGQGIPANGFDWNRDLVEACREMGFDARQGEIPRILATIPDESLSIFSAFHVLEHVSFPDLLDIIDHAVRTLKPGGIAIFETPNPGNLFVSSNNFYMDPTHRHPLPSDLLAFVTEARGLCDLKVLPLSPYPEHSRLTGSECPAVQFINDHFYGPQDYGIVGFKV